MIRVSKNCARKSSRETVLGNHRKQSEQGRVELGLCLSDRFQLANELDCRRASRRRSTVHCARDERLTAFLELEAAVKLDCYSDTNWVLFDPNELQRFAQQKGGFMKKRRGEVLKRLCRSSYYCGSRNSDRENQMKTEEHLEPIAVFIQKVTVAVSELKDDLQQDYERTYPDLGEIIRIVLDEEEAKAWELSFFPHLFLPDMVEAHIANLNLQPG